MAYQTGVASSSSDLLQKLVIWLSSLGWTTHMSQAEGTGWRVHLSKAGVYVNLRSAVAEGIVYYSASGWITGIGINVSTGYDAGSSWAAQPGSPRNAANTAQGVQNVMRILGTPCTAYHFFAEGDNIVVVVEATPGVFTYMGWGRIVKAGAWNGGVYFFADTSCYQSGEAPPIVRPCPFYYLSTPYPTAYMTVDVDTYNGWVSLHGGFDQFTAIRGGTTNLVYLRTPICDVVPSGITDNPDDRIPTYGMKGGYYPGDSSFWAKQFTVFNSQIMMLPINLYVTRIDGGCSLLGQVPDVYFCKATEHGITPGSVLTIGADNYRVFPSFVVKQV